MDQITIVVVLIVAGVILWAVASAPFIGSQVKVIIRSVIIVAVVLWLVFTMLGLGIPNIRVGG